MHHVVEKKIKGRGGGSKATQWYTPPEFFENRFTTLFFWCRKMEKGRLGWSNSWELPGNGVNLSERVRSSIPHPLMYSYSFSRLKEKTLKEIRTKTKQKQNKKNKQKQTKTNKHTQTQTNTNKHKHTQTHHFFQKGVHFSVPNNTSPL